MYNYIPPILTVDAVILALVDDQLSVLLHQRPNEPFKGQWALPGAYCSKDQRIIEALQERVQHKIDVSFTRLPYFEQLYTFDTANRDPRGPTVSVGYLGITRPDDYTIPANARSRFFPVAELPALAFDHADIVQAAVERLRSKLLYTDIVKYALPKHFTLTQLQAAYETITTNSFDKRNFRKRYLSLDVIRSTNRKSTGSAHRPAELYTFAGHALQEFTRAFS
jgi:8-oxo-dGTP diphosphatase